MSQKELASQIPALAALLEGANHVDVKSVDGPATLTMCEFIARTFSYQPAWLSGLFRVRNVFARLLRLPADAAPVRQRFCAGDVPLTPGAELYFLRLQEAQEDRYWIGCFEDKHLTGHVVVAAEPPDHDTRRFHLMTIVHYNTWAGPVYFNVIRPFHHLIVWLVVRQGVKPARGGSA